MDMPGGAALTAPNTSIRARKHPTGFLDLPAELRNLIYAFSGCFKAYQCRTCNSITYHDNEDVIKDHRASRELKYPPRAHGLRRLHEPYISRHCCLKIQEDRVHDYNFTYRKKSEYYDELCGFPRRNVLLWINRNSSIPIHHNLKRAKAQEVASKLPAIAQTCTRLRAEVLSILITTHRIYATMFDVKTDAADILRILSMIGPGTAANMKRLEIVYSKKKDLKYLRGTFMEELKAAGVRTDDGLVEIMRFDQIKPVFVGMRAAKKWTGHDYWGGAVHHKAREVRTKLKLPMCKCEYCVVNSLRGKDKDQEMKK